MTAEFCKLNELPVALLNELKGIRPVRQRGESDAQFSERFTKWQIRVMDAQQAHRDAYLAWASTNAAAVS